MKAIALWRRVGSWLGLVAVFAALGAPVSLLAHDVQNGKLGGLCSAASNGWVEKKSEIPAEADLLSSAHCEACVSSAFALPPDPLGLRYRADVSTAWLKAMPAGLASEAVPGLPFSRGPPRA